MSSVLYKKAVEIAVDIVKSIVISQVTEFLIKKVNSWLEKKKKEKELKRLQK